MRGKTLLVLAGLLGAGLLGYRNLPPHLNPLAPLALDDPPGWLTSFKLRSLTAGGLSPAGRWPTAREAALCVTWCGWRILARCS